ncbi:MAG: radical SAM protein [Elusimicrobia bacterium]|nr:radical SAM protein [Elusimicrobiota bacterium]
MRESAGPRAGAGRAVFIHVPKGGGIEGPTKLLPVGLPAIADFLVRTGRDVSVVHAGLEKTLDPGFDLPSFVADGGYSAALFDLYWHPQSHDVIEAARGVKKAAPRCRTVLGGFTATFFADEIMRSFPEVDFIVRGDPELPLAVLLAALDRPGADLGYVSNLSWRRRGEVVHNPQSYTVTQGLFDRLRFTNFRLIRHHERYLSLVSTDFDPGAERAPVYFCVPGRGCVQDCTYCGGGAAQQRMLFKRNGVLFASRDSVLADLEALADHGIGTVHFNFDPAPGGRFYPELFRAMRRRKLSLTSAFECFGLPTEEFIAEFSRTFPGRGTLAVAPECGSEEVRRRNKGASFTNAALVAAVRLMVDRGIKPQINFTAGLPGETAVHAAKTLYLVRSLADRFPGADFGMERIPLDPGSAWHLQGKSLGIKSPVRSFRDYCRSHRAGAPVVTSSKHLSGPEIEALMKLGRAENACVRPPSPFLLDMAADLREGRRPSFRTLHKACLPCERYGVFFGKGAKGASEDRFCRDLRPQSQGGTLRSPESRHAGAAGAFPSLRSLMPMLTRRCQMGCRYCQLVRRGPDMSREVLRRAIDLMIDGPGPSVDIQLFGGEPLLRRDLVAEAADQVRARALEFGRQAFCSVATNGLLLDAETLDFLRKHEVRVIFSIDGDRLTQGEYRPLRDSGVSYPYRKLLANLQRALRSGWHVQASMVVRPAGVGRLSDNGMYLAELGVRELDLLYEVGGLWTGEAGRRYLEEVYRLLGRLRASGRRMGLANLTNTADEPLLASRGLTVDTDGSVYIGCTLPVEKVLPEMKKVNRVGKIAAIGRLEELRRDRDAHIESMRRAASRRPEAAAIFESQMRMGRLCSAFFTRMAGLFPEAMPD